MKKFLLSALTMFFATAGFAVNVTVSSPTTSSTSPVKISASASSGSAISGWHVYVDGKDSYVGPAGSSISTSISTTTGTHQFVIRAWDSSGAYGDKTVNVNVTSGSTTTPTGSLAVKVNSPTSSAVTSPFALSASASGPKAIVGWHVYVDGKDSYVGGATSSISTSLSAASGSHTVVVRAWDASGAYADQTFGVTVSSSGSTGGSNTGSSTLAVKVNSPTASSSVASPFTLSASASGPKSIVGWHVYVDGKDSYAGGATSTISTSLSAASGSHTLVVRAWDASGAFADQTLGVTVGSSSTGGSTDTTGALPTPPSTAKVYSKIEEMTSGWNSCGTAACAGGAGGGNYWQALNQTSPAMDGRSMEIYRDGKWANALWWHSMGAYNTATNMLWDFYIMTDSAALTNAQALEYDAYQFVGGYNYMIGTECNYAAGVWDTWNELTQTWLHSTVPCPKFTPNQWHHIQMYLTLNHTNHTYTYKTFVIDGRVYNLNQTQPAKYLAWADNIGAQWQLDVNATGAGYHEWVDNAKLTVW